MRLVFLIGLLLALPLTLTACLPNNAPDTGDEDRDETGFRRDGALTFLAGDSAQATIAIEIAETAAARSRGLMNRRSLPPMSGMLFLFEEPDTLSFWMRNTPLPLDIVFVAPDSQIVSIARRTTPYSDEQIQAEGLAQYVVEVRAGMADRLSLAPGMRIRWTRE